MCTIVILRNVHPEYPVLIAANRDEFTNRPSTPIQQISQEPRIIAGIDLRAGGTWMGANEHGFFVGLTNQRTYTKADKSLHSRGEVVERALHATSFDEQRALIDRLDPRNYNPFNLVYGNAERLAIAYARQDASTFTHEDVPDGVQVLPNDQLNSDLFPKVQRAQTLANDIKNQPWPALFPKLQQLIADHELPPKAAMPEPPSHSVIPKFLLRRLEALCIHTPGYGTRSATIAALQPGRVAHYWFSDESPCKQNFTSYTDLLHT